MRNFYTLSAWTRNAPCADILVWNQAVSAGELPVQDIAESVCFAFITRRKPLILRQLLPLHPQSDGLLACINFRFLSSRWWIPAI